MERKYQRKVSNLISELKDFIQVSINNGEHGDYADPQEFFKHQVDLYLEMKGNNENDDDQNLTGLKLLESRGK